MMNNDMNPMQLAQQLRQGGNRQQILAQYAQRSPSFRGTMQRINGKTPGQIFETAQQMANNLGVNLQQLAQRLGVRLPE